MPFRTLAKFGNKKKRIKEDAPKIREKISEEDVLPEVPGIQTRCEVTDIVYAIIKERRSIRKYQKRPVSDDLIVEIVDAARHAPSMGDQQPWEFIVIHDSKVQEEIAEACYNQEWMTQAPVIIVACTNMHIAKSIYGVRGEKLYGIQSVAAAAQNLILAAEAKGLGSCWVGAFSEPRISAICHCPEYIRPCAIITIGWPDENPPEPVIIPIEDILHWEKYGENIRHETVVRGKDPTYMMLK